MSTDPSYMLNRIEGKINSLEANVDVVAAGVAIVNSNVNKVDSKIDSLNYQLASLKKEIDHVTMLLFESELRDNLAIAETRIVKVNQELERKYGNYVRVRNTALGILQATDVGIVKKETVGFVSEEFMITTPGYWLAPCLVSLSSWINNQPDIAEKSVKEAIKRNDEKSSLFFALICRRADRKDACYQWTYRYIENQDPENLDLKCVFMLDAFSNGLLGSDSQGKIFVKMKEWVDNLSQKNNYTETQISQFKDTINTLKVNPKQDTYRYIKDYSSDWNKMYNSLTVAYMHENVFNYFKSIMETDVNISDIKSKLDDVLMSLISDFDEEERPLRNEETYNKLVISFGGDIIKARETAAKNNAKYMVKKDFTRILSEATINNSGEYSSISTQKFAIAFSKDWIISAYKDIIAKNELDYISNIRFDVNGYSFTTTDGRNENDVISDLKSDLTNNMNAQCDKIRNDCEESKKNRIKSAITVCVIAFIVFFIGSGAGFANFLALSGVITAAGILISINLLQNNSNNEIEYIKKNCENEIQKTKEIITTSFAQVVRYRNDYQRNNANSAKTLQFLHELSPEQYIYKFSNSEKRVKLNTNN